MLENSQIGQFRFERVVKKGSEVVGGRKYKSWIFLLEVVDPLIERIKIVLNLCSLFVSCTSIRHKNLQLLKF